MHINWGKTKSGIDVSLSTITCSTGEKAVISNYGASLVSLLTFDKNGKLGDIVLGYDSVNEYEVNPKNVGASIGRYANRIAFGTFNLNGKEVHVNCNRPPHSIHGGEEGFDKKVWTVTELKDDYLRLSYLSKDNEEGFPGNLTVDAIFDFTKEHTLVINYEATTDAPTICSLTNHSYWNLNGHDSGRQGCEDHIISVNSDYRTEQDEDGIPTGHFIPLKDTVFDLNEGEKIGDLIAAPKLLLTRGIDHTYALKSDSELCSAKAFGLISGRTMEIYTNMPAMQVYLGGNLPENLRGKEGATYGKHSAFCMETQHFPDAPNHEEFPSPILMPKEKASFITKYVFGIK